MTNSTTLNSQRVQIAKHDEQGVQCQVLSVFFLGNTEFQSL